MYLPSIYDSFFNPLNDGGKKEEEEEEEEEETKEK